MDHIIRDAAENHHPAYNDKAWEKMEAMLDKQLPQKKDRRKYIFFLLFFLLLGGGILYSVYQANQGKVKAPENIAENNTSEKPGKADDKNLPGNQPNDLQHNEATTTADAGNAQKINAASQLIPDPVRSDPAKTDLQPLVNSSSNENFVRNKRTTQAGKARVRMQITGPGTAADEIAVAGNEKGNRKNPVRKNSRGKNKVAIKAATPETEENDNVAITPVEAAKEAIKKDEKADPQVKEEQKKDEPLKATEEKEKKKEVAVTENKPAPSPDKKKSKNNITGNFGITVSVGPDMSFVSLNKLGKITMMYGAGLSYDFGKRVTVRAGFYASKKIYDANPDQYHTPGGNYPYLYNVAAACKVYEIPVSVSYNFAQRKNHSWFGNVGLSSFLMKTEDYEYEYKTPSGQYYKYNLAVKNQNKHYFSVLTLSAGYKYKLSSRVSLQAEPYVKLPLGGVGAGKVKLNSSGILFTATIKPFARKP